MMNKVIQIIFLAIGCCLLTTDAACSHGWYGSNCQFQCHCSNLLCDSMGECQTGFKCSRGWFGSGCQYQDLSFLATVTTSPGFDQISLTDDDDTSCAQNTNSVTVEFTTSYPVTWIRIIGQNLGRSIFLRFKENRDDSLFNKECDRLEINVSNDLSTADLFCYTKVLAVALHLSLGQISTLCTLHISGGRNLALKQQAIQSSDYVDTKTSTYAINAVDGNTNTTYSSGSCAHTSDRDAEPYWWLQFNNNVHVNRIIIFNRYDVGDKLHCCPLRLNRFKLQLLNSTDHRVYEYNDKTTTVQTQYTIIDPALNVVATALKISVVNSEHVLAICEVQVYGYDVCLPKNYGPECNRTCQCSVPQQTCNVQSGTCMSEVVIDTPQTNGCSVGWFGRNCQFKCNCDNDRCDSQGDCVYPSVCQRGWFGPGCQYMDISVFGNVTTSPTYDGRNLLDGSDLSCVGPISSVTVHFDHPYPAIWIQVVGINIGKAVQKTLRLKRRNIDSTFLSTFDSIQVIDADDNKKSDILFETNESIELVDLTFDSLVSVCSLHISGGRNLALKQTTRQSSTYVENGLSFVAGLAVDGNTNRDFSGHSCAHTQDLIPEPFWEVHFLYPAYVKRVVLYNRRDADTGCCPFRLNGFKLQLYSSTQQQYHHTDTTSSTTQTIYTVDPQVHQTFTALNISVVNRDHVLALCEVEVYGYDACPVGWYGPGCNRQCRCLNCNALSGTCLTGSVPTLQTVTGVPTCGANLFGPNCQYTCRCSFNACDTSGACLDRSMCLPGWFGAACQYKDLATVSELVTSPRHNPSDVNDGDSATCVLDLDSFQVNLTSPFVFTWMRLVVLEYDDNTKVTLRFRDSVTGTTFSCLNMKEYVLDSRTTDFHCNLTSLVDQLNITFNRPRSVCSFHISGGRSLSLRQQTIQSSTYSGSNNNTFISSNAVDGDTNQSGDKCARTAAHDVSPYWLVKFPRPYTVSRFAVYNGLDVKGTRRGYTLYAMNSHNVTVFHKTVTHDDNGITIISSANIQDLILYVRIEPTAGELLTLCEVEVFGDAVCPSGWFGPECERKCNCANSSEACLVSSGGCQSGCAPGFKGEGCSKRQL